MSNEVPKTTYLKDYKKPDYLISDIHLTFELDDKSTKVLSKLNIAANTDKQCPLVLDGELMELRSVTLDGKKLNEDSYEVTKTNLIVKDVPRNFTLEIENIINPENNKALEGLYKSGSIFCTQNEPEGFRRITYYIDRPDVMAKFTTKIIGDKKKYPVMLSNGNPIESGDLESDRHYIVWEDPFPKPAYLYALVAGDLGLIKDSFKTMSGRDIELRIYCDKGNESKCDHAMKSLKKSMKWDEDKYGREYDLDIFMIVAVDSFNMGAMENKGLNIFNSCYVLANSQTATDDDFMGIESVVAHEYFHNWTGNRITCRDWFQLTLKEGLTVFRDQTFSGDINSQVVQRIEDVLSLRMRQFPEDGGPNAHPIKPESYMEINNFYTSTVYEKGAEIIRMLHTYLGEDGFRKGMDKYFELYDGQAVTTEDFLHALSVANDNFDMTQFKNWYSQAGTPKVKASYKYDESKKVLSLTIEQDCPPTPGQDKKKPFQFPLMIGLLGRDGKDMETNLKRGVLDITKQKETFEFSNINELPVVSLNRNFSAPITVEAPYTTEERIFLMGHDNDPFNRYENAQQLAYKFMSELVKDYLEGKELNLDQGYIDAYGQILKDKSIDNSFKAMSLILPPEEILHQGQNPVEIEASHNVRKFVRAKLAKHYKDDFLSLYNSLVESGSYKLDSTSIGKRTLKNVCLGFLMFADDEKMETICFDQFKNANNMTDEIAALSQLSYRNSKYKEEAIKHFYEKWKHETLVIQKWLIAQALSPEDDTYNRVLELEKDPVYDKTVPNLVRSLIGVYARANNIQFHHPTGRGYKLVADRILEMDKINPTIASALAQAFHYYQKSNDRLKPLMKAELERIKDTEGLSKNTYEIISKTLA